MLRLWKGVPSLMRKFIFVVVAFGLLFLIYLLSSQHEIHRFAKASKESRILNAIKAGGGVRGSNASAAQKVVKVEVKIPTSKPAGGSSIKTTVPHKQVTTARVLKVLSTPVSQVSSLPGVTQNTPHHLKTPGDKAEKATGGATGDIYSGPKNEQQRAVKDAFLHAWRAYKKYAWGHDELRPLSKGWQEWFGVGLTLVDSLDTMWIMGLKDEFKQARDWVKSSLTFNKPTEAQLFEIVIRELGGLLSAYHLSKDQVFADKAKELGDHLMPCFNGPTKIPCRFINLANGRGQFTEISTAESGTIQLEFRDLSRVTNDPKYEKAVQAINEQLHRMQKMDGLVSCFINPHSATFRQSATVSAGASADSYYEYLLKQWIQTGKTKNEFKEDYLQSIAGIKKHLLRYSSPNKLAFVGALNGMSPSSSFRNEMEHLACFLPGTMAMGAQLGLGDNHLDIAKQLTQTCYEMYRTTATGLSPEVAVINIHPGTKQDIMSFGASYNLQRPEAVESIFYLYRVTKNPMYRKWGWEIFQSFEKHTKLKEGYASIDNVRQLDRIGYRDKMESFYLAETLKYLYLLFSDDDRLIPLDKFVFNTEAHPLPIYDK